MNSARDLRIPPRMLGGVWLLISMSRGISVAGVLGNLVADLHIQRDFEATPSSLCCSSSADALRWLRLVACTSV